MSPWKKQGLGFLQKYWALPFSAAEAWIRGTVPEIFSDCEVYWQQAELNQTVSSCSLEAISRKCNPALNGTDSCLPRLIAFTTGY